MSANNSNGVSFICDSSYDPLLEVMKYVVQWFYLSLGGLLIAYMLYVMLIKEKASYCSNSYYKIFIFELVTSLYLIIHDVVFGRLTIYIAPLCPIIAPFFSNYSVFLKLSMISINYVRASKSICQIFLTTNRLTCVLFPVYHRKHWDRSINSVILANTFLPFGAIWSLMMSRVYANNTYGGFSSNYIRAVDWASLSRLQSIYLTVSLTISTFNSIATLYGLTMLTQRVKNVEKRLCIATLFITTVFMIVAATQYVWVFCSVCSKAYPSLYGLQFISYDVLNIGTPVTLLMLNEKLRAHMFPKFSSIKPSTIVNTSSMSH